MGYHRAGFDVVGVDVAPQPHYPFAFHQADATTFPLAGFDAVHASPPCHDHSALRRVDQRGPRGTGWMLAATLDRLGRLPVPWAVENVEGAPMGGCWSTVCGTALGMSTETHVGRRWLKRHRLFASSVLLMVPPCGCSHRRPVQGVYGHSGGGAGRGWKGYHADACRLMGIDWMTRAELVLAIPPAYTEWIGAQLLAVVPADG